MQKFKFNCWIDVIFGQSGGGGYFVKWNELCFLVHNKKENKKVKTNREKKEELSDYKVLCFNGIPKLVEIHRGRFSSCHTQDFYDTDWNKTDFVQSEDPPSDEIMSKPVFADQMFRLSAMLARGIPHVRIDWYYANGHLYFGEMTFYDGSGFSPFAEGQDEILGGWLDLPQKYDSTTKEE